MRLPKQKTPTPSATPKQRPALPFSPPHHSPFSTQGLSGKFLEIDYALLPVRECNQKQKT